MDVETVGALASRLAEVADRVRSLEQRLSSGLDSTEWVGQDRERFAEAWRARHVVALRHSAEALDDASRLAWDNVREQDRASA